MSLQSLQCALAALFTDPAARERFARDSDTFTSVFGLNAREREQLEAMSASAIASYAATLARKRRAAAAPFLARTRGVMNGEFERAFDGWADATPAPRGRFRGARDAAHFCRFLLRGRALGPGQNAALQRDRDDALASTRPAILRALRAVYRN